MLTKDYPDHHDAELVLKLYDLRREAVLREARKTIVTQFWPRTLDDLLAIGKTDHPLNGAFRQVSTYWEMAFGMARHGILHADYMCETSGEGLFLYAKVEPWLSAYREKVLPFAFLNAEWVATHSVTGQRLLEHYRRRVKTYLENSK